MTFSSSGGAEVFVCFMAIAAIAFYVALLVALFRMAAAQEKMADAHTELSNRLGHLLVSWSGERGPNPPPSHIPSPRDLTDSRG